jgi:hypothetical protein
MADGIWHGMPICWLQVIERGSDSETRWSKKRTPMIRLAQRLVLTDPRRPAQ